MKRRWLSGVLLALPSVAWGGEAEVLIGDAPGAAELRVLRDPSKRAELQAELIYQLGDAALDTVVETLARGWVQGFCDVPKQTLSAVQERAIRGAILRFDAEAAFAAARRTLQDGDFEPTGRRRAWLEVLGLHGGADELEEVVEWLLDLERSEERPESLRALRASLQRCFAGTIGRGGLAVVEARWTELGPLALETLVEGLGDVPHARGGPLLGEVLLWRRELTGLTLARIQDVGAQAPAAMAWELTAQVLRFLDDEDVDHCRAAILALGALRCPESVEPLIDQLESSDAGIRSAAHFALREISLTELPLDPGIWRSWLALERGWDLEGALQRIEGIRGAAGASSAALLREVSAHPLYRARISEALIGRLPDLREPALGLTLRTLERFGVSPPAGPTRETQPSMSPIARAR